MVCPPATSEAGARWPRRGLVVVATTSCRDNKVHMIRPIYVLLYNNTILSNIVIKMMSVLDSNCLFSKTLTSFFFNGGLSPHAAFSTILII
jgi:hypothetical protein